MKNALLFGLLSACTQNSTKRALRVTRTLNILDEVKSRCMTGMAVKSFPPLNG